MFNLRSNDKKKGFHLLALLAVLVLSVFIVAGCGSDQEESQDDADKEKAEKTEWYQSILDDKKQTDAYPYYRLLDIDQDGTDELFLSSTEKSFIGAEDKAKLMADVDGKAVTLKKIGGAGGESFSYDESDKSLFYYSRVSGEEHIVQYKLEKGALKEIQTSDKYDEMHDPKTGDNAEDTYYLDGKQVKEVDAEAIWDQYDDVAKEVTYSKDGKGTTTVDDDADDADDAADDADGDD